MPTYWLLPPVSSKKTIIAFTCPYKNITLIILMNFDHNMINDHQLMNKSIADQIVNNKISPYVE